MKTFVLACILSVPLLGHAQGFALTWYKVAGGGGISSGTNGSTVFTLAGTIGQQDASTTVTGGTFALTGGFWSQIAIVQNPSGPSLSISPMSGGAMISWPSSATNYFLQFTRNLETRAWNLYPADIVTNGSSNTVMVPASSPRMYFRLGPGS
jgi:hypothetical protein